MNAPEATTAPAPQHMRALARANEVRLARAELKRRIGHGEVSVAEIVLRSPWEADSMTISDLLMSQRRWGSTRCRKLLQAVPMSENKTVGSMTERQRRALADLLTTWVERYGLSARRAEALARLILAGNARRVHNLG